MYKLTYFLNTMYIHVTKNSSLQLSSLKNDRLQNTYHNQISLKVKLLENNLCIVLEGNFHNINNFSML